MKCILETYRRSSSKIPKEMPKMVSQGNPMSLGRLKNKPSKVSMDLRLPIKEQGSLTKARFLGRHQRSLNREEILGRLQKSMSREEFLDHHQKFRKWIFYQIIPSNKLKKLYMLVQVSTLMAYLAPLIHKTSIFSLKIKSCLKYLQKLRAFSNRKMPFQGSTKHILWTKKLIWNKNTNL